MLRAPQPPPSEIVLTGLLNDLTALKGPLVVVLDDYHLVDDAAVDEILLFVLEHLPAQMHMVIATRMDPPLPLSRMRARGQLNEIRAAELRFTSAEAGDFLEQTMGLELSPAQITALGERTEGWIAGLQLAAISMRGLDDPQELIASFSGSHRLVLDYLIDEVLSRQPPHVHDFLLQTAILGRLTGPLCNALTGEDDGQEMLELLDGANVFIVPLDDDRQWYRYHHLFGDLLRRRLEQSYGEERVGKLHLRASRSSAGVWGTRRGAGTPVW